MNKNKDNIEPAKAGKEAEYSRICILVPKDFHKKVKHRALEEDTTVTDLIYTLLEKYLKDAR